MIVVADTSPLNYLLQLGRIDLLPALFHEVIAPAAVVSELRRPDAPLVVRQWAIQPPAWLLLPAPTLFFPDVTDTLDDGEREAIQIALNLKAAVVLMDERAGAAEAQRLALKVTGTLGILLLAGERGLIDVRHDFECLIAETNFRSTAKLQANFRNLLAFRGL